MNELEITKYLVDYRDKSTAIVFAHTVTSILGTETREDTLKVPGVGPWTLETLQAAVSGGVVQLVTEKAAAAAAEVVAEATKFSVPLDAPAPALVK